VYSRGFSPPSDRDCTCQPDTSTIMHSSNGPVCYYCSVVARVVNVAYNSDGCDDIIYPSLFESTVVMGLLMSAPPLLLDKKTLYAISL
jgi:hypothetical protein